MITLAPFPVPEVRMVMPQYPFQLVDVFGETPFSGNPLAVIALEADRDTAELQQITRWLNLSETAFLLPPTTDAADYRVRIFTLDRELPFAGHPTLGSAHAWLALGGTPRHAGKVVQECGAGLIDVRLGADGLAFAAPALLHSGPVDADKLVEACSVLGIAISDVVAAEWIDNGPGWLGIQLKDAAAVIAVEPARSHASRIDIGLVGLHPAGSPFAYEVRAIFSDPYGGLIEDPVTGSLNASAAEWMLRLGHVTAPYTATQGTRLGRSGRIRIEHEAGGPIWVGGATATLFAGTTGEAALPA